jgi:hypothetical protein
MDLLDAITKLRDEWAKAEWPHEQTARSMEEDLARAMAPFEAPVD